MPDNTFATEVVARAVELMRAGVPNLRARIAREYPELTGMGVDRVIDLARAEIGEQDRERNVRAAR